MNVDNFEWNLENQWLVKVVNEVKKQLNEKRNFKEKLVKDALETQKELWQEIGVVSVANGLEQIVDFMGFIGVMKGQKRSHELTRKLQEKYEKMLLSPYFGRIDFLEKGQETSEKCYIGISNLINDDYDFLIYDWRAPVSSMFYDFETGDAFYKCPQGIIDGKLTLKRQYKIYKGILEYMFDSNLKIDDEILQELLSKSTDSKMKTIVTTIQREQNRVIRNEDYKNLIVQGPAGSGKTSIALHRIAYLLYKHRDKITPQNIVIFSPNQIFNDYISSVLPELGEDNMYQTTFKEYMHKALDIELVKEDYCDMMEYILTKKGDKNYGRRVRSIKYKSSLEFLDVLRKYADYLSKADRDFTDIIFMDRLIISGKEIGELFHKDYFQLPLKRRLRKIRERILYLLKPYEKERIAEIDRELEETGFYIDKVERMEKSICIVREELKALCNEINRMTDFDLMDIYKRLFQIPGLFDGDSSVDRCGNKIKGYTLESLQSGILNYEDQPPLLYLKGALGDTPKTSEIKYVIIDEAQDYTPLQYEIFYQLFNHAGITMLGDLNQSINPFMNVGNYSNISALFPEDNTCIINLSKSYRSTLEITNFSRALLNKEVTDECVERRGDKPQVLGFKKKEDIQERILQDICMYKDKGHKSIGIITRTVKETDEAYNFLKDRVQVKSVKKDDEEYINDTLIIPAYLAKGLEFDVVLIYNAGNGNYSCEEERLLFYTACTRALHVLNIYYSGELTPFISNLVE